MLSPSLLPGCGSASFLALSRISLTTLSSAMTAPCLSTVLTYEPEQDSHDQTEDNDGLGDDGKDQTLTEELLVLGHCADRGRTDAGLSDCRHRFRPVQRPILLQSQSIHLLPFFTYFSHCAFPNYLERVELQPASFVEFVNSSTYCSLMLCRPAEIIARMKIIRMPDNEHDYRKYQGDPSVPIVSKAMVLNAKAMPALDMPMATRRE